MNQKPNNSVSNCIYEYRIPQLVSEKKIFRNGFPTSFHRHAEFIYVQDGTLRVETDRTSANGSTGDLFVIFPNVLHTLKTDYSILQCITFLPEISYGFTELLEQSQPEQILIPGISAELQSHLDSIHRTLAEGGVYAAGTAVGYIQLIMGEIVRKTTFRKTDNISNDNIHRVISYCSDHFREDISMQSVADALYISKSYVSQIFNKKLGCQFTDYINYLRCNEAAYLLLQTKYSVMEIMTMAGFQNQSTFNRVFRETFRIKPSEYRKEMKQGNKIVGSHSITYFPPLSTDSFIGEIYTDPQ